MVRNRQTPIESKLSRNLGTVYGPPGGYGATIGWCCTAGDLCGEGDGAQPGFLLSELYCVQLGALQGCKLHRA